MNKKRLGVGMSVGFVSLLVIFVTLCLVTFAILSLTTVRSDVVRVGQNEQNQGRYYAANNESQAKLAQIDEILYQANQAGSEQEYLAYIAGALDADVFDFEEETGEIRYRSAVSESTDIYTVVKIGRYGSGGSYEVAAWNMEVVPGKIPEQAIDLWDGEQ
ncbi:MAG: hypothetical protein ACOYJB_07375 [Christensenellaceae bacterium]|jgi:hypothetical protein